MAIVPVRKTRARTMQGRCLMSFYIDITGSTDGQAESCRWMYMDIIPT